MVCAVLCWVTQLCPTLCYPMDCSPPGSSVNGDSPGKNTRVGYHALLQGAFPTWDQTQVSSIAGGFLTAWATREAVLIGDWNAKVGSQETPGVTGKFGLGIQKEAGQRLIEFCQENALVIANTLFNNTREDSIHGHHQMDNTKIRLIILFAAKDGEALYSQQKQDWELTVAQIMKSLLENSDLNWGK